VVVIRRDVYEANRLLPREMRPEDLFTPELYEDVII
jgi:hypothetical protein